MEVYVVLESNRNTEYEYCGVYKTRELAEKRIKEIVSEFGVDEENLYIQEEEI